MADDTKSKWESFWNKIVTSIDNLVTLEITTSVGALTVVNGKVTQTGEVKAMHSVINLAVGDIKTEVDPAFVTGEYKELRQFHMDREKQGHEIVNNNIKALKSLVEFALQAGRGAKEAGADAGKALPPLPERPSA